MTTISIVECPRDAWQGFHDFIPTAEKIKHIKNLMHCGFHTIDAGSFVSPRAMPQMADAQQLFAALEEARAQSETQLLSIVASEGGARRAAEFNHIDAWGYPFSVSEVFQERNSRKNIKSAIEDLKRVKDLALQSNVELVVYLSMAFGNPYGENHHPDIVAELTEKLHQLEIGIVALSDTIGVSNPTNIAPLFSTLIQEYPSIEFGAHFHTTPDKWEEKVESAYQNGCRRFDAALKGYGGCPMAKDDLVGNMPTEKLITYFTEDLGLNRVELDKSLDLSTSVFK